MVEKIGHVKNPLTVIAIFAALAEVSGTVVFPLLEKQTQLIYVWFLMGFPLFLVAIFFYVLYRKHHVLYAPTDFKDDKTFEQLSTVYHSKKTSEIVLIDKDLEQDLKIERLQRKVVEIAAPKMLFENDFLEGLSFNWSSWPLALNTNRADYVEIRKELAAAGIPIAAYFGKESAAPDKWVISISEAMPFHYKLKLLSLLLPFGFDGIDFWIPYREANEAEDIYVGSYGSDEYSEVTQELFDLMKKEINDDDLEIYCTRHRVKAKMKKAKRVIEEESI